MLLSNSQTPKKISLRMPSLDYSKWDNLGCSDSENCEDSDGENSNLWTKCAQAAHNPSPQQRKPTTSATGVNKQVAAKEVTKSDKQVLQKIVRTPEKIEPTDSPPAPHKLNSLKAPAEIRTDPEN
jgi:hypothetical protein